MYQNAVIEREISDLKKPKKSKTSSRRTGQEGLPKKSRKLRVIREEDLSSVSDDSVMVTQKARKVRKGTTRRKSKSNRRRDFESESRSVS